MFGGAALLAAAGLLSACAGTVATAENNVAMEPMSFNEIAGWADDRQAEALAAFRRSCPKLVGGGDSRIVD